MPINPTIPLSINPPIAGDPGIINALRSQAFQLQQQQQAQQAQNALRGVLSDPASLDPATGMPNQNAMRKIMAIDPALGVKYQQNALALQSDRLAMKANQLKLTEGQEEAVSKVRQSALAAFDQTYKSTGSQQAAIQAG